MSKKQRILNQWARHNASILTPIMIGSIKQNDYRNAGSSLLKCVACGRYRITCGIVKYFDYNPTKLLCYECQEAVRSNELVPVKEILSVRVNS